MEMAGGGRGIGISTTLTGICSTLLVMTFSLLIIFHKYKNKRKNTLSLPPGPKPWPFVGSLPEMLINKPTFRWIHRLMEEVNSEIICISLGNVSVIPVTSPEIACEFLKKCDSVFSSRPICLSAKVTSQGYLSAVLAPMGDQWKKMRRVLASEVLCPARFRWLHKIRVEEADHLVRFVYNQSYKSSISSGLVDIRATAKHYCANAIRRMIFGKRFFREGREDGGPSVEDEEHVDALFTILEYLYSFCISDYIPWLRGNLDLDDQEKIIKKAVITCRKYQDPIIEERVGEWKKGARAEKKDWLDVLITLVNEDGIPLLSIDEIKAQITELMLATVDNPSNAIEWALAEMLNQPEILKKALEELDTVVGKERLVQESDLPQLNYVKACIKEAFRLHPVAPFNVPHVSVADTTVAGYFIPKGSHVLLSRPGLGRNPRVWEEPLKFQPERHLKADGSEVGLNDSDLRMLSFSIGRRGCAGVTLGSAITTMLMARLLQGFTWKLPPKVSKIELKESANTLFLAKPLLVLAEPRLAENLYFSL
ncbi:tyrosine N-monooxygenase-like [Diospyros lotus]|uniref:tyrosine N-monooxygenase-like n=1 Tax=Diospyros lotus TaxID=55363 RepID=UPI002253AAE9|nr:tyrosine N-monooxygenase-like [Diospyros lotus]